MEMLYHDRGSSQCVHSYLHHEKNASSARIRAVSSAVDSGPKLCGGRQSCERRNHLTPVFQLCRPHFSNTKNMIFLLFTLSP